MATISDIAASGKQIQDTYDQLKGSLSQSQIDALSSSVQKATSMLPKPSAPTNVTGITQTGPIQTPTTKPTFGDTSGAFAVTQGVSSYLKPMAETINQQQERQLKAAEEQNKTQTSGFLSIFGKGGENITSPAEARRNALDETGIDVADYFAKQEAGVKEIETLQNEYDKVQAEKDERIAKIEENANGALQVGVDSRVLSAEKLYSTRLNRLSANINAKAATLQAQQGNFAEAQKYVNQAVIDATADAKFKFDMYSEFYTLNEDSFNRTESVYADAYKSAMDLAGKEYDRQVADKRQIAEWMLKYPSAGISISDTFEEALGKAGSASGSGFDSTAYNRAQQVLSGQSALSDFTAAEQAKIRDVIWTMNTPDTNLLSNRLQMSIAPNGAGPLWENLRMSVAGPGTGSVTDPMGQLTPAQQATALNYLYTSGGTSEDIERFYTDRGFQAFLLSEAGQ